MYTVLLILLLLTSLVMATAVLLQAGQGGGLASLGGAGGTSDMGMGGRPATTLLHTVTWGCAGIFLFLALVLALMSSHASGPRSVLEGGPAPAPAPVQPAPLPIQSSPAAGNTAPATPPTNQTQPPKPNPGPTAGVRAPGGWRLLRRNRAASLRARLRRSRLHDKSERVPGGVHRSLLPRPARS